MTTTTAYLASGLLGAYVAHDLTWVGSGLLQASLNQLCVQGGLAIAKDHDLSLLVKQFLKVGLIALAIIFGEQLAPLLSLPLNPHVVTSIAAFNLITSFVLDFINYTPIEKKQAVSTPAPSGNQPIISEKITWKGELTLPKPEMFGDLNDFFKGFFCMSFTHNSRSGVSKEFEDIFYLTHFPPEMLARKTGVFLKPPHNPINLLDAVVTECITFDSREEATAKIDQTVTQFLQCHHILPKKLIIPFGGSLHTACIVIEPQESGY